LNGKKLAKTEAKKGYLKVARTWKKGDSIRLELPMPVERVYAHRRVKADAGRVALMRGPVVYCLEGVDNHGQVRNLCLPWTAKLSGAFEKDLFRGAGVVRGEALAVSRGEDEKLKTQRVKFQAVPYSAWDNRKPGQMVVWLAESPELAEVPGDGGVVSRGVQIRASHVNPTDTLAALNDGVIPKSSGDHGLPRMTWWDHKGTTEWVSYRFVRPRRLRGAAVYWFDDTGRGACRVPASWRLLWPDGDLWKPVTLTDKAAYGTALDRFNQVTFEPVTTRELKLEVKLKANFSGGILEWTIRDAK
jgi:hypothetical protein